MRSLVVLLVLFLILTATVQAAPARPDYLGRFALNDPFTVAWQVTPDDTPQFNVYREDVRGWSGLLRGPLYPNGNTYSYSFRLTEYLGFSDASRYMICAETTVADVPTYAFWTFEIGGKGHKPIRVDAAVCP